MDSSSLQAICLRLTRYDCARISGLCSRHTLMPGHNGLFARQFPIASSYSGYSDIPGLHRRRFDLFAIKQLASAIVSEDLLFT